MYFSSDLLFFGYGQTYFNFQYIYLKKYTLRTILNEVVTVERINEKFTIEVKILRQQHSQRTLDMCVCVKSHSNKKALTSKKFPVARGALSFRSIVLASLFFLPQNSKKIQYSKIQKKMPADDRTDRRTDGHIILPRRIFETMACLFVIFIYINFQFGGPACHN